MTITLLQRAIALLKENECKSCWWYNECENNCFPTGSCDTRDILSALEAEVKRMGTPIVDRSSEIEFTDDETGNDPNMNELKRYWVWDGKITPTRVVLASEAEAALKEANETWRCFHCDFKTNDHKQAEAHFGEGMDSPTLCMDWADMDHNDRLHEFQNAAVEINQLREEKEQANAALKAKDEENVKLTASLARANARLISLQVAATVLLEKCDEADLNSDLPENIDGSVLDLVRSSLSAQPKGDAIGRIAQEVLGECPLNDEEARRLASRILSAIAGVEK